MYSPAALHCAMMTVQNARCVHSIEHLTVLSVILVVEALWCVFSPASTPTIAA
jgi:hypothetical protein